MTTLHKSLPPNSTEWPISKKFQALIETASLGDTGLNHYCRQKGLYKSQLDQWKSEFMSDKEDASSKKIIDELRSLRTQNKRLKGELNRKEKALAEASALLLLKKNLDLLWEENEENPSL
jgi:transposase